MTPLGPVIAKVTVPVNRSSAWALLARPSLRAEWWPDLELEMIQGGAVRERWEDGEGDERVTRDASGSVDVVVPEHALGFRWQEAGESRRTAVLITLASHDGSTSLTVTETGFDGLDDAAARAAASQEGWNVLFRDLADAAESLGDERIAERVADEDGAAEDADAETSAGATGAEAAGTPAAAGSAVAGAAVAAGAGAAALSGAAAAPGADEEDLESSENTESSEDVEASEGAEAAEAAEEAEPSAEATEAAEVDADAAAAEDADAEDAPVADANDTVEVPRLPAEEPAAEAGAPDGEEALDISEFLHLEAKYHQDAGSDDASAEGAPAENGGEPDAEQADGAASDSTVSDSTASDGAANDDDGADARAEDRSAVDTAPIGLSEPEDESDAPLGDADQVPAEQDEREQGVSTGDPDFDDLLRGL